MKKTQTILSLYLCSWTGCYWAS